MAARERMLARPAFFGWLPVVSYREDDLNAYRSWLARAKQVPARIQALLAEDAFEA